jgi:integrase
MAGSSRGRRTRGRGTIDELESGALRVRVYAGIDPLTQKRLDLVEVVPPGPKAWREAEEVRDRLVRDVAEQRNPRTNATLDQLLQRYLEQFAGSPNTRALYEGHIRNHISPALTSRGRSPRAGGPVQGGAGPPAADLNLSVRVDRLTLLKR